MRTGRLTDLARQYRTDKYSTRHNFMPYYEKFLSKREKKPITLLEIGVEKGCSIRMWLDYFQQGQIIGLDLENLHNIQHKRFEFYMGNQTDERVLKKIIDKYAPFDVVVDDASHRAYDEQLTLSILFPYMKSGGHYFVEDLGARRKSKIELTVSKMIRFWTTGKYEDKYIEENCNDVFVCVNNMMAVLRKK